MSPHQKTYRFCIEPGAGIGTLEGVLAIVRRLDLELCSLRSTGTSRGLEVQLRLGAQEEDALTLCRMRLHNVVGILSIREMPSLMSVKPVAPLASSTIVYLHA